MKNSTSNWKDKKFRSEYGKRWREKQKANASGNGIASELPPGEGQAPSKWAKRVAQKKAQEVRPLLLPGCPECGGEFLRRVNEQIEPMKLSSCPICDLRFYKAGGRV